MNFGGNRADLRAWLEAAILSAGAALPSTPTSSSGNQTAVESIETVVESSTTAAESQAIASPAIDNFKRSLVTVRRISEQGVLKKGYHLIKIDGWTVVTKESDRFFQGQFVLFFEPDSFLPGTSPLKHLFAEVGSEVTLDGEVGYRVGTSVWTDQNGCDVISQGHVLHLDRDNFCEVYEKIVDLHWNHIWSKTDEDFADAMRHVDFSDDLGVKKWKSPENMENMDNMNNTVENHAIEDNTVEDNAFEGNTVEGNTDKTVEDAVEEANAGNVAVDKATIDEPIDEPIDESINAFPTCNPSTPSFVPKTSMERVQNCPNLFIKQKYKRFIYQESLKMDGACMTIYFIQNGTAMFDSLLDLPTPNANNSHTYLKYAAHPTGRFGVCSSNKDLLPHLLPSKTTPTNSHYWDAAIAANLHMLLPTLDDSIAIQAELVGQTIQGNPYNYPKTPNGPTHELFIFSIMRFQPFGPKTAGVMAPKRWHPHRVESFAAEHGLNHVPVLGYHKLPDVAQEHEDLIARAECKKGEGLVYKCCTDGRWFKILSERWILEKGDEKLVRVAQAQLKRGKEKVALADETKAAMERQEARSAGGWSASREETEKIMAVLRDLEDWMKRDDGLKEWMEAWEEGYGRRLGDLKDVDCAAGLKWIDQVEKDGVCGRINGKTTTTGGSAVNGVNALQNGQCNGNTTTAGGPAPNGVNVQHNGQINGVNVTGVGSTTINPNTQQIGQTNGTHGANVQQTTAQQTSQQNGQNNESIGFEVAQSVVAWLGL